MDDVLPACSAKCNDVNYIELCIETSFDIAIVLMQFYLF